QLHILSALSLREIYGDRLRQRDILNTPQCNFQPVLPKQHFAAGRHRAAATARPGHGCNDPVISFAGTPVFMSRSIPITAIPELSLWDMACDEVPPVHSITSSASVSNLSGISRPSAFAVLRLITNSNFVGSITGRSPGFSPLRMRPA